MGAEHFDVVVVGAGISGIAAAHHLQTRCPNLSFLVLERRASFGGTWDLFKYPGIRSDSDMFTMGFEHRPWGSPKLIAPKEDILAYLKKTIDDGGLAKHIRFHKNIVTADWNTSQARWSLQCQDGSSFTCNFLYGCTGYFEHDKPFEPEFPGADRFRANGGILVHPQKWPEDLDYTGKRVAVIGSGATAITLVPSMAGKAKHVTMVQRSPTWILPVPNYDITAGSALEDGVGLEEMHRRVRERRAEEMSNGDFAGPPLGKDISLEERSQTYLKWVRDLVPHLSDAEFQKHFVPKYKLWEQRLCASPDGDFFVPLREGKASIVTDHIKTFDETGILMESGEHVDCDIVAAATGLNLHANAPMADIRVNVDGKPYVASEHRIFRDCMLSDVPNFMFCIGYFNISWTMKVDLVGKHLCRILTQMKETGSSMVCPRLPAGGLGEPPALEVSSSYWVRNWHLRPKHGKTGSWQPLVTYEADRHTLLEAPITDECLHFSSELSSGDLTASTDLRSRL